MKIRLPNAGKDFENQWKASVPSSVYYQRIKDPAQSFTQSNSLRFSLNNPYDCFIFSFPILFTLELKSTQGTSMTFYRDDFINGNSKSAFMIKKNQIQGLLESAKNKGVVSGFILNFRKQNLTYFLSIDSFIRMSDSLTKKSFNLNDVQNYDGYLINQTLKRTKYQYDIGKFILDMTKEKLQNEQN